MRRGQQISLTPQEVIMSDEEIKTTDNINNKITVNLHPNVGQFQALFISGDSFEEHSTSIVMV